MLVLRKRIHIRLMGKLMNIRIAVLYFLVSIFLDLLASAFLCPSFSLNFKKRNKFDLAFLIRELLLLLEVSLITRIK